LETVKNDNDELKKLKITICQNLSVVLNQSGDNREAIKIATKALQVDPNAVKALYQRAMGHMKCKNFNEATQDLKAAIKLNPQDKNLRT